jgi:hypothetical protein
MVAKHSEFYVFLSGSDGWVKPKHRPEENMLDYFMEWLFENYDDHIPVK